MQQSYSFLDVKAAITGPGGAFSIGAGSGSSEEGITVTSTEDFDTMTIGADGQGMHSLNADKSGTITIRLLKTSDTNALLMAMANFQRTSGVNHGQNTISISNVATGDNVTCEQVAFAKIPDLNYQKAGGMVEWRFHAITITPTLGAGIVF